jgi:hypothetical protein
MKECQYCSEHYEPTKNRRAYCSETCQENGTKDHNKKRVSKFRENIAEYKMLKQKIRIKERSKE